MEDPNVWKANYTPETKEMLKELSKVKPMILSSFPEVETLGYKSPIEVIMSDMVMKEEDQVMQAVWNVGVNVDKAELVRALAYDRDQYAAGYQYAKRKYDRPHGEWIPCSERLPEDLVPVNVTYVNHEPEPYYKDIKDKPFTATAVYFNGQWYWWSTLCTDILAEYSHNWDDIIDEAIEITSWMPLPEPYKRGEAE